MAGTFYFLQVVRENLLWEHSFFIGIDGVILCVIFTIILDVIEFIKLILDNILGTWVGSTEAFSNFLAAIAHYIWQGLSHST
jgi:hypothetical protein